MPPRPLRSSNSLTQPAGTEVASAAARTSPRPDAVGDVDPAHPHVAAGRAVVDHQRHRHRRPGRHRGSRAHRRAGPVETGRRRGREGGADQRPHRAVGLEGAAGEFGGPVEVAVGPLQRDQVVERRLARRGRPFGRLRVDPALDQAAGHPGGGVGVDADPERRRRDEAAGGGVLQRVQQRQRLAQVGVAGRHAGGAEGGDRGAGHVGVGRGAR